jgi:hypothetical protein
MPPNFYYQYYSAVVLQDDSAVALSLAAITC